jgi:hypothetical protein
MLRNSKNNVKKFWKQCLEILETMLRNSENNVKKFWKQC